VADDHVDVRITGTEEQILGVEKTLGTDTIYKLAQAARTHDVMISITVTPYADDVPEETDRGPDER